MTDEQTAQTEGLLAQQQVRAQQEVQTWLAVVVVVVRR